MIWSYHFQLLYWYKQTRANGVLQTELNIFPFFFKDFLFVLLCLSNWIMNTYSKKTSVKFSAAHCLFIWANRYCGRRRVEQKTVSMKQETKKSNIFIQIDIKYSNNDKTVYLSSGDSHCIVVTESGKLLG